uniref:Uncharacterized protein n=1 Tax=Anguilla anguilla TaxID=7936 RepID=A0A0E9W6Z6_ANGAN
MYVFQIYVAIELIVCTGLSVKPKFLCVFEPVPVCLPEIVQEHARTSSSSFVLFCEAVCTFLCHSCRLNLRSEGDRSMKIKFERKTWEETAKISWHFEGIG